MKRVFLMLIGGAVVWGLCRPPECPAPLIWRKGEGWTYERAGVTVADSPKEQLALAKKYQAAKDYGSAASAYRRLIRRWPTATDAEEARLGLAECLTATEYLYKAFKEYQQLVTKHPSSPHFETVLQRQFEIGNLFMAGARDKVWGVKLFGSPEKAIEIYEQVIKNGPYSTVAPQALMRIGLVHEKQKNYLLAVRACERLLERYPQHDMAEDAQFQIAESYRAQAGRAEYDQNAANQAVAAYTDFLVKYPSSEQAARAESYRAGLKHEQAKGLFQIGHFYEKQRKYRAALIYYNEVIEHDPGSQWANDAKDKVSRLTELVASR